MRVAERARISQNMTPHVLRYYLPFLTMSGNGEPPRIWTGDFRDRVVQSPRTSPDIVLCRLQTVQECEESVAESSPGYIPAPSVTLQMVRYVLQ
jgi:hypothetical protein